MIPVLDLDIPRFFQFLKWWILKTLLDAGCPFSFDKISCPRLIPQPSILTLSCSAQTASMTRFSTVSLLDSFKKCQVWGELPSKPVEEAAGWDFTHDLGYRIVLIFQ